MRLLASCAFALFVTAGVSAQQDRQDAPQPGQEGPPPAQQDRPSPPPDVRPPQAEAPARQLEPPQPRADASPSRADRCGAVAYTSDGAFGASYGMENCSDAERLAIEECRRESTDKGDCARGVIVRKDSWFYIQFCRRGGEWTTHVSTKQTLVEVNNSATEWASRSQYGAQNCRLVPNGLFHSGGLHAKM